MFTAEDVIDAGCVELTTLSGALVRVASENGGVTVNGSNVVQADILGEGGVIHGINGVILPGSFSSCGDLAKGSKKGTKRDSASSASSASSMSSGKGSRRRA